MIEEQSTIFFAEVQEAFQFLVHEYGYRHLDDVIENANYGPDRTAICRYVGMAVGIQVSWFFAGSNISVGFIELQQPYIFPKDYSFYPLNRPNIPKVINLSDLAEVLKKRNDDDFLVKEVKAWRQIRARAPFIEEYHHDIVEGLARATQRCATEILNGDTSRFAEVMAYGAAKYRRLHPDAFLPGLKLPDESAQEE
jgi:hypothetical protein